MREKFMKKLFFILTVCFCAANSWAGILDGETVSVFHYNTDKFKSYFEITCARYSYLKNTCQDYQAQIRFVNRKNGKELIEKEAGRVNFRGLSVALNEMLVKSSMTKSKDSAFIFGFTRGIGSILKDNPGFASLFLLSLPLDLTIFPFTAPTYIGKSIYDGIKKSILKRRIKMLLKNENPKSTKLRNRIAWDYRNNYRRILYKIGHP